MCIDLCIVLTVFVKLDESMESPIDEGKEERQGQWYYYIFTSTSYMCIDLCIQYMHIIIHICIFIYMYIYIYIYIYIGAHRFHRVR